MSGSYPQEAHIPGLGAVFDDRTNAEEAVDALRRSGLADVHLGAAIHKEDHVVFEEDAESELAHGLGRGAAVGAPIGAIAGMSALALIVPGVGVLGVAGILAVGGATGALAGGFWGAYLGLKAEEHVLEDQWDWEQTPLQASQVLVVVDQHGHPDEVKQILENHRQARVDRVEPQISLAGADDAVPHAGGHDERLFARLEACDGSIE